MIRSLIAKRIYTENGLIENGSVTVSDERILRIGGDPAAACIDFGNATIIPGLIDTHIHGGGGFDAMDATPEAICALAEHKAREGVTAFCPSTVTTSLVKTKQALRAVMEAARVNTKGARLLRTFCEGPYISAAYKGAHPAEWIAPVSMEEIADLLDMAEGTIGSFALAPEKENANELISYLVSRGVQVRLGHSAATAEVARNAVSLGANTYIHTYNAMSPLNHREPGMVGAALTDDRAYCELIVDFVHVSKTAVEVVYRCKKPENIILITDALMATGLPDGVYELGDLPVHVQNGVCRTESGSLAGSTLRLLDAVKNMESLGIAFDVCVRMASANPAKALGLYNETGSITEGKLADITVLDEAHNVLFVMSGGRVLVDNRR